MSKMTAQERLAKLQREAEQMAARLEQAKAVVRDQERKKDTRRKAVLGGLVIKLLRDEQPIPQSLAGFLRMVTRDHDRKAFDGWTLDAVDPEMETPKAETTPAAVAMPPAPAPAASDAPVAAPVET
ncbi:MAG TPA: hypothetical protein VGF36_03545 [Rhodopila sp.]